MNKRKEKDSLGEVEVPSDAYYGAQTARSLLYFNIGGDDDKVPFPIIWAYGLLKKAAAIVNHELGLLSKEKMEWIVQAADEVIAGKLKSHFPLSIWQTGSGTQTNMNVNEVIANRAIELAGGVLGSKRPIHPNDDVNMSQSSNDTFPTVMHIAAADKLHNQLLPTLRTLRAELAFKVEAFSGVVKMGRTHLMDALPITLGQEFSGYLEQIDQNSVRIEAGMSHIYELAIGGTAVGTGFLSPPYFGEKMAATLAKLTQLPFVSAKNKFAALSAHDPLVAISGALRTLAVSLTKIGNDLAWMGSGPRCGLSELKFPENEPGSSIMPGKINPTQCEALLMVATQVMGLDSAIAIAGSRGNFELNVFKPMIIRNLLRSIVLLADVCNSFTEHFLKGLTANSFQIDIYVERSLMLVTALRARIGYDKAAEIALKAYHENLTLKQAALALNALSEEEFDAIVVPKNMV